MRQQPQYLVFQESRRAAFRLTERYNNDSATILSPRALAWCQWHHVVNRYIWMCASLDPPAQCIRVDTESVYAAWPEQRGTPPCAMLPTDSTAAGAPKAQRYDPLCIQKNTQLAPLVRWFTQTVVPVVLRHLCAPPRLLRHKRGHRPPTRRRRHHVVRRAQHIVIRRHQLKPNFR